MTRGHTPATVCGIVLAGGRATRFGSDKLSVEIDGLPLLWRAIAAVASVATDVRVVVAPASDPRLPTPDQLPSGVTLSVVRDPESHGGPLVGLAAGLESAVEASPGALAEAALIVAGDMPALRAALLRLMLDRLMADPTVEAVVLADGTGSRGWRPLPAAVRPAPARRAALAALGSSERSLQSGLSRLRIVTLEEEEWRRVDPEGESLRDVDVPADLASRPRGSAGSDGP